MDVNVACSAPEGFPAAIAFAGTSDAAAVFRPSAFRSRGSWAFATVRQQPCRRGSRAAAFHISHSCSIEMCCRHVYAMCRTNNVSPTISSINLPFCSRSRFRTRMAAARSKAQNPNACPLRHFPSHQASAACRKRHPVSGKVATCEMRPRAPHTASTHVVAIRLPRIVLSGWLTGIGIHEMKMDSMADLNRRSSASSAAGNRSRWPRSRARGCSAKGKITSAQMK